VVLANSLLSLKGAIVELDNKVKKISSLEEEIRILKSEQNK
jgi:hypothetical protein